MHSLTWKLTLAFLLVGLTGASLVAIIVGQRTRSEFDRFLSSRDQTTLVDALVEYHASHGSWDGVGDMLSTSPPLDAYSRGVVLLNPDREVVLGNRALNVGETLPEGVLN